MAPIGLIAGQGVFPLLVARGARAAGRKVVCIGLSGNADPALQSETDVFAWASVTRPGKWFRVLKKTGCTETIMVGRVAKSTMYKRFVVVRSLPDWRALKIWFTRLRHYKRPGDVLRAMIDEFASEGIPLTSSTQFCSEHLATPGVMTKKQPTETQWADIHFGWDRCATLSRLDIGQALALLDHDIIAVEALEGTGAMIERAGQLCKRGGWTLIKVGNATGDLRLDVPSVGLTTIEQLHAAGAACLVLEPGKTMLLEKPKVLEMADRWGIAVVGYEVPAVPSPARPASGAVK